MPPKAPSPAKKRKGKEAVDEEEISQEPDPNVLLYLQAASRAFPAVERSLQNQSNTVLSAVGPCESRTATIDDLISAQVRRFTKETEKAKGEIDELKEKKLKLQQDIKDDEETFLKTQAVEQVEGERALATLEEELHFLQEREREANEWARNAAGVKREVDQLRETIFELKTKQRNEIESMRERYREEERKMREQLVRRLRRTRDYLTATADDDAADESDKGKSSSSNNGFLGTVPSTKVNERLSREVSMYERESRMVKEHNETLMEQEGTNRKKLERERAENERLVLRNASHAKTRKVLEGKKAELDGEYRAAMDKHTSQHSERRRALHETIDAQSRIIDDLNSELELGVSEYERLRRVQKQASQELLSHDKVLSSATRFMLSLATDPDLPSAEVVTVPELGLNTRLEVANFLSTVITSM